MWSLVIMFNTLSEHLFICQSLLKERRRPPSGGLREAIKESLGRGFHALAPWGEVKNNPLLFGLPRLSQMIDYCFGMSCPHRGVSCRSLFLVVGTTKGLVLIG